MEQVLATAMEKVDRFRTVQPQAGPVSVWMSDVLKRQPSSMKMPLNIKSTEHARRAVPIADLEPSQETVPIEGLRAYIVRPRRDPIDVAHVQMRDGTDRYVIQEGHARAGAAALRGEAEIEARVWEFEQDSSATILPVPRGLQRRGMARAAMTHLSHRERLVFATYQDIIALAEWDEDLHPRGEDGKFISIGSSSSVFKPVDAKGPDTQTRFKDAETGKYTPQRTALHKAIIKKVLGKATAVEAPVATIFGGGPASGKSTIADELGMGSLNAVFVDVDKIRADIPEYREMTESGSKTAASFTHEESSDISKYALKEATDGKRNVVLDGTGDSGIESLESKIGKFKAAGQRVEGVYVTVDTETAVRRAEERGKKTGRYVPEPFIRKTHAAVSRVLPLAIERGLFDKVSLYDTNGKGKLVASAEGTKLVIHDKDAWEKFLAKGR